MLIVGGVVIKCSVGKMVTEMTNEEITKIKTFIREYVAKVGRQGVVVGLSGGLDSSVVAKLCVSALGSDSVFGLHLPDSVTPESDTKDVKSLVDQLLIEYEKIPITAYFKKYKFNDRGKDKIRRGNFKARLRMMFLYDYAHKLDYLVAGTGNKSEILLGYFTKHGDGGCDFLPIAHLYKTQVKEIAKELDIPQTIIDKKPSAVLWKGQTDEEELGMAYEDIDKLLTRMDMSAHKRVSIPSLLGGDE